MAQMVSESSCVTCELVVPEIVLVTLCDRAGQNTFTPDFVAGLVAAFAAVRALSQCKVVVVRGYDNYFCCGASRDELLKISSGQVRFDELGFYRLLLDCELPVIAAMQGHAIGGGLIFGCYADLLVLARESLYSANFMKYGFTPGMGATHLLPLKLGSNLGAEMLWRAEGYTGDLLQRRGVPCEVLPRTDVVQSALANARLLAQRPRKALLLLKARLTERLRQELPDVIAAELAMHEHCFADSDIDARVRELYGRS
jgi:polyketide biosynthesis enoyl-CoA hydratase PksI